MGSSRASDDGKSAIPYLICRSNACLFALPLSSVAETMRPLPIEPLAGMPAFVLGVSIIRGVPVPIVDAARLLSLEERPVAQRVVTLKVGERRIGLAVERVVEIRALPSASLADVPPLLRAGDEALRSISALDTQLLLVLEEARVVPESVWAAIDSQAAAPP